MVETALSAGPAVGREFRIGRVLRRTFGLYFRHFLTFLALGLIPALPNIFYFPVADAITPLAAVITLLAGLVLYPICQAMVLYGAFQAMRGRPVRLGETVQKALARFLPVIGVAICLGIALIFGFTLLFIPGLVILTMYSVALPVCVVERPGVFASLKRSAQLTKGHRWRILGLLAVVWLANLLLAGALGVIIRFSGPLVAQIVNFIWGAVFGAFFSIVFVVAYHDLRVAKEGIDIERIAAVFD